MTRILLSILTLTVAPFLYACPAGAQVRLDPGIAELFRLDLLPAFKRSVQVGSVSSYDRTGGNDDGFSGMYSFVRKESGGLVIADLKGPGVIYRIWTPTPTDDMVEFYFDEEAKPRIRVRFIDLFSGRQAPFLSPVVGIGAGGFYSYLPLPYKKSCKVVVKAERVMFYQVNYATYSTESRIESYTPLPSKEFSEHLDKARKLLTASGSDVSSHATFGGKSLQTHQFSHDLLPGKAITIFRTDRPGRLAGMRLGPAQAFAGKGRDVVMNIYWDGESSPAISCPVSDLFGYAWGQPAMKSLLLGTSDGTNYVYLPMPFDKSARIELVSEKTVGPAIKVRGEIKFTDAGRAKDEGKLYVLWRRENLTVEGRPFIFIETEGKGHVVGFILQAQGIEPGGIPEFFEGDDQTTIDGEIAIRGTGSEDFFNGGWYDVPGRWEDRVSMPLSGSLDFKRHLARTGGYRFMITDVYPYKQSILSTIEHGPVGNNVPTDYTSVTFFYSENRPTANLNLPRLDDRRVADPHRIVFTPGWTSPIHAFSWSNASLEKRDDKIGDEQLRHLSMKAEGREVFGDHYISFICEMPAAGKYKVSIEAIKGPGQAIVQVFKDEVSLGEPADLYSVNRVKSGLIPMTELEMREGDNRVMFKLVGRNSQSAGLGFDLYRIIFERVR